MVRVIMENRVSSSALINLSLYKSQLPKIFHYLIQDNVLKADKNADLTERCLEAALLQDNPAVFQGLSLFAEVIVGVSKIEQRLLELNMQRKKLEKELSRLMEEKRLEAQQKKNEIDEDDEDY